MTGRFFGALALGLLAWSPARADAPPVRELVGTFQLDQPNCAGGRPHGSWLAVNVDAAVVRNRSSTCAGGAYTLLSPGTTGLRTGAFGLDPTPTFDRSGNSLASSVIEPVAFNASRLGIGTSPFDVQDAPRGPVAFDAPRALARGGDLVVDLRSLEITYRGAPGSTCASAAGAGCWEEGSAFARGTLAGDRFSLTWVASQAFVGVSAGLTVHLEGRFVGTVTAAPALTELPAGFTGYRPPDGTAAATTPSVVTPPSTAGAVHRASLAAPAGQSHRHGIPIPLGAGAAVLSFVAIAGVASVWHRS